MKKANYLDSVFECSVCFASIKRIFEVEDNEVPVLNLIDYTLLPLTMPYRLAYKIESYTVERAEKNLNG